ncbi:unnamed protein product [Meloidogyne enterolobii]|uniref:Uncharacterized protein n=1 Tax=Meloidogyne enterolobii TaxID=390850 RepID=A0ACB1A4U4_MELEN
MSFEYKKIKLTRAALQLILPMVALLAMLLLPVVVSSLYLEPSSSSCSIARRAWLQRRTSPDIDSRTRACGLPLEITKICPSCSNRRYEFCDEVVMCCW